MQRFLTKVMVNYLIEILEKDLDQDHRTGIEKLLDEQKAKLAALETSGHLAGSETTDRGSAPVMPFG